MTDIDWAGLDHAYGSAEDVPALLEAVAGTDEEQAKQALNTLWGSVGHQGTVYSAAPPVAEFMLELAATPHALRRGSLIGVVAGFCRSGEFNRLGVDLVAVAVGEAENFADIDFMGGNWVHTCRAVAVSRLDRLVSFLTDPDPEVRHAAAYLVPTLDAEALRLLPVLRAAWDAEADERVRAGLTLAAAELSAAGDHGRAETSTWLRELMADARTSGIVRFAAAIGYRWHTGLELTPEAATALAAAAADVTGGDLGAVHWLYDIGSRGGVAAWLTALYPGDGALLDDLAVGLLTAPEPETRASAAVACLNLASRVGPVGGIGWSGNARRSASAWTSAGVQRARELVTEAAVSALTDPAPEVRRTAAARLTRLGRRASWVRDELAAAVGDPDGEVAAWATVALANTGDERAVEPLGRFLAAPRCPWRGSEGTTAGMLLRMRPHAGRLHPILYRHLCDAGDSSWTGVRSRMIAELGAWGSDAASLATAIWWTYRRGGRTSTTVIKALGRIGPAAAAAAPELKVLAEDKANESGVRAAAAWAHWRITGSSDLGVPTLRRLAGAAPHEALEYLADVGPLARSAAPTVQGLLGNRHQWTRIRAAYTLWRLTGETEPALPVLVAAAESLGGEGHSLAATWAIDRLGRAGQPISGAVEVLEAILSDPARTAAATWPHHADIDDRSPLDVIEDAHRALCSCGVCGRRWGPGGLRCGRRAAGSGAGSLPE